jgi:thiamine-phosphate pyrophosphorylase
LKPLSVPRVYAIADAETLAPRRLPDAVGAMADAGVRWIQIRAKRLGDDELYDAVESCCRRLEGSGAELWIDDRADVVSLFPVAGLHVGRGDLPPLAARRVVGERWIGSSTHDLDQVTQASEDPAVDLIAVGPVFATESKADPDPVVGLEGLRQARRLTRKPIAAIGGIGPENVASVWAAGADTAAMIGAVCRGDVANNCRRLLRAEEAYELG